MRSLRIAAWQVAFGWAVLHGVAGTAQAMIAVFYGG